MNYASKLIAVAMLPLIFDSINVAMGQSASKSVNPKAACDHVCQIKKDQASISQSEQQMQVERQMILMDYASLTKIINILERSASESDKAEAAQEMVKFMKRHHYDANGRPLK